jgi:hypothetical protein
MRFLGTMAHMKESTGHCIEAVLKIIRDSQHIERTEKTEGNKKLKSDEISRLNALE